MRKKCWTVVDYENSWIIVRCGIKINGQYSTDDFIVPVKGQNAAYEAWENFNEWQYGKCPYVTITLEKIGYRVA